MGTRLVGWLLAGILGLGLVWLGAVAAEVRAGLHAGLAVALLVAWRLPGPALRPAGERVLRIFGAGWLVVMAAGAGLFPIDRVVGAWIAPGILRARPDDPWWTAALSPEDVAWAVAAMVLAGSAGVLGAVWGARQPDDERLGDAMLVGAAALIVAAVAHAATGARAVFGWILPVDTISGPLFGPLVNANHLGGLLLVAWPLAVVRSTGEGARAWLARVVAVAVPVLVLVVSARAPAALLVVQAVALALVWSRVGAGRAALGGAIGFAAVILPVVAVIGAGEPGSVDSLAGRAQIWSDASMALADHPLLGVGAGGFEGAFEAYRTDHWRATIAHAHHDVLEWVVETGLVGALALLAATLVVWGGRPRDLGPTGLAVGLGLAGLAGHATVDFPLSIPAIAMVAAAVAGALGARAPGVPGAGQRTKRLLFALALLNSLGVGLSLHRSLVDGAEAAVRAEAAHPERTRRAAATLEWWAPWRGWDRLHAAWRAERAGDPDKAVVEIRAFVALAADDDEALRPASLVLLRAGRVEEAAKVAERAIARGGADYRNHVARARVAAAAGDPFEAAGHYLAAIERDAPFSVVEEAWDAHPVAVWWIDRLEGHPRHGLALAARLASRGDPEEALLAFDVAAAGDPEAPPHPLHALALARTGRVDEAVARAQALADGGSPVAIRALGEVLLVADRPGEAAAAFERVERDFPIVRAWIVRAVAKAEGPEAGLLRAERYRMAGLYSEEIEAEAEKLR